MPRSIAGIIFFIIGIVLLIGALAWGVISVVNGSIFIVERLVMVVVVAIIGAILVWIADTKLG